MNFKQWPENIPSSLQNRDRRFFIFLNYAYIFSFAGHMIFLLPLYTMLTDTIAFRSNIVCIFIDITCFILLRRGKIKFSFMLLICAITVHTTLSIIFFGTTSCLQLYFFTLIVLSFFSPWGLFFKITIGMFLTGLAISLTSYSIYNPPIVEITSRQLIFWNTGNILANCIALGYGVYYFSFIVDTSEEKLKYQAEHDLLTGVLNRNTIIRVLLSNISGAQNYTVSAIMGDIDCFKKINDTYGHLVGDEVLKSITGILSSSLRERDALGRFGGEEFIMVLPACDINVAVNVAERIRTLIASSPVSTKAGKINVTMSFGVASLKNGRVEDGEELLKRADEALYRAKDNGRNRVEYI